jgi:hypothetical protein
MIQDGCARVKLNPYRCGGPVYFPGSLEVEEAGKKELDR